MAKTDSVVLDGDAVEGARRAAALTRPEIAKRARLCSFTVWCMFHGRPVSLRSAKRLSRTLGVDVAMLIAAHAADPRAGAEMWAAVERPEPRALAIVGFGNAGVGV